MFRNFETKQGFIGFGDLQQALVNLGFSQVEWAKLATLIKLLDPQPKHLGMIDYRVLVRDLKQRPFGWWQERI